MEYRKFFALLFISFFFQASLFSQHSVAREWNEELLNGIRNDFARPTVHARNLFHHSVMMYDIWAAYDSKAETFLLGKTIGDYECLFEGVDIPESPAEIKSARIKAISFAMYRLINYRFRFSPGYLNIKSRIDNLMAKLGYDPRNVDTNYKENSDPAAFGNYVAKCMIEFGLQDGSNEQGDYANISYRPVNAPLVMAFPGNLNIQNPNRWQPLTLDVFIDQAGNVIPFNTPPFLGAEWGQVVPFALSEDDLKIYNRNGFDYWVYHDPGRPPQLAFGDDDANLPDEYKWGFSMVAIWSSHLDPTDGVMWDISPNSLGNSTALPKKVENYRQYYNTIDGGGPSQGRRVNPHTGQPYEVEMVPRGDYARVLAEFWADGPDSETPPGHWFTILNDILDNPEFSYKFEGKGEELDTLEYEVKAYFALGGAMHDCAITAWGIKGWYDYLRPVSAIRYMADKGQSTSPDLPNYHPDGIPLVENYIELVTEDDPIAKENVFDIGKIKIYAWRGPDYINDPKTDDAGVGWILAENWWPYQRPSFVTPPFAGYVSGHSTYSRAAAEVLTLLTGDEYFPGGMGVFDIKKNDFLVFEEGPSIDMELQWATYRDASDQTSLSRIWGGIHPPADDIPGRKIGIDLGLEAYAKARSYFGDSGTTATEDLDVVYDAFSMYPNPNRGTGSLNIEKKEKDTKISQIRITNTTGAVLRNYAIQDISESRIQLPPLIDGMYFVEIFSDHKKQILPLVIIK